MTISFPLKSFFNDSWKVFKQHWKFLVPAILATGIIQFIINGIQNSLDRSGGIGAFLGTVFTGIVSIIIVLGWSKVLLKLVRENTASWETFKTKPQLWLHYIKAMIWYGLYFILKVIICAGPFAVIGIIGFFTKVQFLQLIGFILAGITTAVVAIFFGIRYMFINYSVLDLQDLRSKAIFKRSGELTKGYFWKLLILAVILLVINIVGAALLLIGLLVTVPLSKLIQAKVYQYLKHHKAPATHSS